MFLQLLQLPRRYFGLLGERGTLVVSPAEEESSTVVDYAAAATIVLGCQRNSAPVTTDTVQLPPLPQLVCWTSDTHVP